MQAISENSVASLMTFTGFCEAVKRLIEKQGTGTGLANREEGSFYILVGRVLCSIKLREGDDLSNPAGVYQAGTAKGLVAGDWHGDSWKNCTAEAAQLTIHKPIYVRLNFGNGNLGANIKPETWANLADSIDKAIPGFPAELHKLVNSGAATHQELQAVINALNRIGGYSTNPGQRARCASIIDSLQTYQLLQRKR